VELDVSTLALFSNEDKCVDSETLDVSVAAWDTTVTEMPSDHVSGFGFEGDVVPETIVR